MTNISSMEVAELRPFFRTALRHLEAMQASVQDEPSQTQATDNDADNIAVRRVAR